MRLSPLRYPGGKSKAIKILKEFIPPNTKTLCSPFFGGGSFELYCASIGIKVYGYDILKPLVDFWQTALNRPNALAAAVEGYWPLSKRQFKVLYAKQFEELSKMDAATIFFVLNRTSFSGSTLCGGMATGGKHNNPRFTKSAIEKLRHFKAKNISVNLADFETSIKRHKNTLLYLDPPYMIESNLYGRNGIIHKGFDHHRLAKILHSRKNWILSYGDSKETRKMYAGYRYFKPEWNYGMSADKSSSELIILSDDIKSPNLSSKFKIKILH